MIRLEGREVLPKPLPANFAWAKGKNGHDEEIFQTSMIR